MDLKIDFYKSNLKRLFVFIEFYLLGPFRFINHKLYLVNKRESERCGEIED